MKVIFATLSVMLLMTGINIPQLSVIHDMGSVIFVMWLISTCILVMNNSSATGGEH